MPVWKMEEAGKNQSLMSRGLTLIHEKTVVRASVAAIPVGGRRRPPHPDAPNLDFLRLALRLCAFA